MDLSALTEEELVLQIRLWKAHPISKGILELLREEMELALVHGRVRRTQEHSDFSYDVGFKDGQNLTTYKILKPETWLFNALFTGETNDEADSDHRL